MSDGAGGRSSIFAPTDGSASGWGNESRPWYAYTRARCRMSERLYECCFVVNRRPYCVYDWQMRETNLQFIRSIDTEYFRYLAQLHHDQLEGDNRQRAAVGIRNTYHHATETLLTFLCGTVQAPDCIFAWIPKCKTQDLRDLVLEIKSGNGKIVNKLGLDAVSWRSIAELFAKELDCSESERTEIVEGCTVLWSRLANEFLSEKDQNEYNSLKHGFRSRAGGFTLSVGPEATPGVAAPPENMRPLGGSDYGSTFHVPVPLKNSPLGRKDHLIYSETHSMNWNPVSLPKGILVITDVLSNVLAYLRLLNGQPRGEIQFVFPERRQELLVAWEERPSVLGMSMNRHVYNDYVERKTPEAVLAELRLRPMVRHVPEIE
jgi:hypothetical protein